METPVPINYEAWSQKLHLLVNGLAVNNLSLINEGLKRLDEIILPGLTPEYESQAYFFAGRGFLFRWQESHHLDDLEKSIEYFSKCSPSNLVPGKVFRLHEALAVLFQARYIISGNIEDLNKTIDSLNSLFQFEQEGDLVSLISSRHLLGKTFFFRYEREHEVHDLEQAVTNLRIVSECFQKIKTVGKHVQDHYLNNNGYVAHYDAGMAYYHRWKRFGESHDLEEAKKELILASILR